ncbi:MAG: IclR family transcriptional regulator [Intrasporangium sp.]|uniref:IclR family transcriptional regulator n=1 Tax=Intrasporangium sp. TaxID=1925024 RepID=UPI002649FEAC|nr:IclR family transcriptional regulator [Intrasporangium sp.]MDN5796409.1 IclR family transcriptional regulator [Intrasporangium sp.]
MDHALQLAVILQVEGPQTVSAVARRLGVARSTAHRLLAMLVYRDFARQGADRRYFPGPVISLESGQSDLSAVLREISMPHLQVLVDRVGESANVMVLAGDHIRFIASVESSQAFRVGNREGMVLAAHLTSGGKAMLAELSASARAELYDVERWEGRDAERPDLQSLEREMVTIRRQGFAINRDRTETGVTAIGRVVRIQDRIGAAVAVSMPTVRFQGARLSDLVSALAVAARDIEHSLGDALEARLRQTQRTAT